jgi:hypothetical protein
MKDSVTLCNLGGAHSLGSLSYAQFCPRIECRPNLRHAEVEEAGT